MKKSLLFLFFLFIFAGLTYAQPSTVTANKVKHGLDASKGATCSTGSIYLATDTGKEYLCPVTTWVDFGTGGGASGITIGTTTITSGTGTRVLYETAGNKVGEISGATSDGTTLTTSSQILTGAPSITGIPTLTPTARSSGVAPYFTLNIPADTSLTASTEAIGFSVVSGIRQHATGAVTEQREVVFAAPTYSAVAASTFTRAVNFYASSPLQGTNATLTKSFGAMFEASAAAHIPLAIRLAGTPTGDAFQVLTASNTVLANMKSDGTLLVGANGIQFPTQATAGTNFQVTNAAGTIMSFSGGSGGYLWENNALTAFNAGLDNSANLSLIATGVYAWMAGSNVSGGTKDTGIARNGAGVVEFNNGTAGTLRDWTARASTLSSATAPITFSNAAYQSCTSVGSSAGGVLTCTASDQRLKQGFGNFSNGLETILRITPQTFHWKAGTNYSDGDKIHLGLIGQNLQAANPLLVSATGAGILQPEPMALHAVEIDAIQQLDAQIKALTAIVDAQQKEIKRLRRHRK